MPKPFAAALLRLLLAGPQRAIPPVHELYMALVVPRAPGVAAFVQALARLPNFRPHYVYLNLGGCLAVDPSSAQVFIAGGGMPMDAVVADFEAGGRGFGYRLRLLFADGSAWEARTLVSVEPLLTAAELVEAARARLLRGEPPPAPQPISAGLGA